MSARIYIEGGGDTRGQQAELRDAFVSLFKRAQVSPERVPTIICAGSRNSAFDKFCNSLREYGNQSLLLVDSESPVSEAQWIHVRRLDGWVRPESAKSDQIHLMVEMMENWFLADRKALADYFGQGFSERHLPGQAADIEAVPKARVTEGLRMATRGSHKGAYSKARDGARIIRRIDPALLRRSSRHFDELLAAVQSRSA